MDMDYSNRSLPATQANGKNLNGKNLNGKNLNGSSLGSAIAWVSLENVRWRGKTITVSLGESEFSASTPHGALRGADIVGAQFLASSDTGESVLLKVVEATPPSGPEDYWRYRVNYKDTDANWYPLCLDGSETLDATAVRGYWDRAAGAPGDGGKIADPERFTFACPRVGAIGKCIEFGYRPWAEVAGVSLDTYHQTCVRLIRADYCGDGISWTTDGKLVNLYDDLGVQDDSESWPVEAEWDADGARCVRSDNRSLEHVSCFSLLASLTCGADLLAVPPMMSELPPQS